MFTPCGWAILVALFLSTIGIVVFSSAYSADQANVEEIRALVVNSYARAQQCTSSHCIQYYEKSSNCRVYERYTCYSAHISYEYTFNSMDHHSSTTIECDRDNYCAERAVRDHRVNSTVVVFVDADTPTTARLTKEGVSSGYAGLVSLACICYLFYCCLPCCLILNDSNYTVDSFIKEPSTPDDDVESGPDPPLE
jgi:hypothetical protein